jgi:hypothetical protein
LIKIRHVETNHQVHPHHRPPELDQVLKWGLVARNFANNVDAQQPDKEPVETLTQSQVQRLLEVLKVDHLFSDRIQMF